MIHCVSTVNWGANYLLPFANEICEGYVFTGVCLSTGGSLRTETPLDRDPLTGQRSPPGQRTVTSGRYASYWNAFLLVDFFSAGKPTVLVRMESRLKSYFEFCSIQPCNCSTSTKCHLFNLGEFNQIPCKSSVLLKIWFAFLHLCGISKWVNCLFPGNCNM